MEQNEEEPKLIIRIVKLLAGISMAATIGESTPRMAKKSPTRLYRIENTKLLSTIDLFALQSRM